MSKAELKQHPAVTIAGLKYTGKNQAGEIPKLWEDLMARMGEIPNLDEPVEAAYGISIMPPDFDETQVFDYIGGYGVSGDVADLPAGMEVFEIPEGQYAVIVCPNLASISEAYDALYTRWLPESGFELDLSHGNFCFELYGMEFMPAEGKEKFTIWVPVKEK